MFCDPKAFSKHLNRTLMTKVQHKLPWLCFGELRMCIKHDKLRMIPSFREREQEREREERECIYIVIILLCMCLKITLYILLLELQYTVHVYHKEILCYGKFFNLQKYHNRKCNCKFYY